jgi:hypothetical protein
MDEVKAGGMSCIAYEAFSKYFDIFEGPTGVLSWVNHTNK